MKGRQDLSSNLQEHVLKLRPNLGVRPAYIRNLYKRLHRLCQYTSLCPLTISRLQPVTGGVGSCSWEASAKLHHWPHPWQWLRRAGREEEEQNGGVGTSHHPWKNTPLGILGPVWNPSVAAEGCERLNLVYSEITVVLKATSLQQHTLTGTASAWTHPVCLGCVTGLHKVVSPLVSSKIYRWSLICGVCRVVQILACLSSCFSGCSLQKSI